MFTKDLVAAFVFLGGILFTGMQASAAEDLKQEFIFRAREVEAVLLSHEIELGKRFGEKVGEVERSLTQKSPLLIFTSEYTGDCKDKFDSIFIRGSVVYCPNANKNRISLPQREFEWLDRKEKAQFALVGILHLMNLKHFKNLVEEFSGLVAPGRLPLLVMSPRLRFPDNPTIPRDDVPQRKCEAACSLNQTVCENKQHPRGCARDYHWCMESCRR